MQLIIFLAVAAVILGLTVWGLVRDDWDESDEEYLARVRSELPKLRVMAKPKWAREE